MKNKHLVCSLLAGSVAAFSLLLSPTEASAFSFSDVDGTNVVRKNGFTWLKLTETVGESWDTVNEALPGSGWRFASLDEVIETWIDDRYSGNELGDVEAYFVDYVAAGYTQEGDSGFYYETIEHGAYYLEEFVDGINFENAVDDPDAADWLSSVGSCQLPCPVINIDSELGPISEQMVGSFVVRDVPEPGTITGLALVVALGGAARLRTKNKSKQN